MHQINLFKILRSSFDLILAVVVVSASCMDASAATLTGDSISTITSYTSASQLPGYAATKTALSQTTGTSTYYVSPTGNDQNSGTSSGSAFKNLQTAVSKLRAGDTLNLMSGTYTGTIYLKSSGTSSKYITIKGNGSVTIIPPRSIDNAINTSGHDYIQIKNIKVKGGKHGVSVSSGSHHIAINGLATDKTEFGVFMKDASFVTVTNARVTNARNGFRGEGNTHDIAFSNIETSYNKEGHVQSDGFQNGDGFIFEGNTYNLVFKNIKTSYNSDAGLDIKGDNVLIENVVSHHNTNGMKLWGNNIVVRNALIYDQRNQYSPTGRVTTAVGLNARAGNIKVYNSTFYANPETDVKATYGASIHLENSIITRTGVIGTLRTILGKMTFRNNLWYRYGVAKSDFFIDSTSLWTNPNFVNLGARDFRPSSVAGTRGYRPFTLSIVGIG